MGRMEQTIEVKVDQVASTRQMVSPTKTPCLAMENEERGESGAKVCHHVEPKDASTRAWAKLISPYAPS